MKRKVCSIAALLAILMLVFTSAPLANTNSAVVASSLDAREVIPAAGPAQIDPCACLYSGMDGMKYLQREAGGWDPASPDTGTWADINIIPRADADGPGFYSWGNTCPGLPWSYMYEDCADWVYGNVDWDEAALNTEIYKLPFTVSEENCLEVHFEAIVDDTATFYIKGPGDTAATPFFTIPALSCTPTEFSIDADADGKADCLLPGEYTIYIKHQDTHMVIYGLIFTAECMPCECPCLEDLSIAWDDITVDAFATDGWQTVPFPAYEYPVYDSENRICVRVHNIGCISADNVVVNVYWYDFSSGIPWPGPWNFIDSTTISSIPAGGEEIVCFDWIPTESESVTDHRCLFATAECASDPITSYYPSDDNNVAQHNVDIISLTLPQTEPYITEFVLNPIEQQGERDLIFELLGAPKGVNVELLIPPTVQIGEIEGASSVKEPASRWFLSCSCQPEWQVAVTSALDSADTTAVVSNFSCDREEVVKLKITVPEDVATGGEFTIRLTEELNGEKFGEATFIVQY